MSVCIGWYASHTVIPKTLPVTTVLSTVVLSVLAVEVWLTVARINMSMVRRGIGGGWAFSRS